jgi:hypothetical protein
MSVELKIKSKSLAAEATIIRKEEARLLRIARELEKRQSGSAQRVRKTFDLISVHRRREVREEARATFLARAYLDGKKFSMVERPLKDPYVFELRIHSKLVAMIRKYGNPKLNSHQLNKAISNWISGADPILEENTTIVRGFLSRFLPL